VKSKCDEPLEDEGQGGPRKRDREAVIEAVRNHFEEIRIDHSKLVQKFLRIKKDDKVDLNYNLRKPTRPRYAGNVDPTYAEELFFRNV
jgi:hypothetical protein